MKKIILYTVLLINATFCNAQLQENHFVFSNPVFQNYTIKNGLLFNYINGLLQDKKGYIWIGTQNGLCRFDGNKWIEFQQQNGVPKHRLPSNWVVDITEDDQSNIWIKTDNSVCKYDTQKDSIIFFPKIIKGWGKIVFAKPNNLYVSSWTGITHYKIVGNKLIHKKTILESANNSILHLYNDTLNNTIWACPEDHPTIMSINTHTEEFKHLKNLTHNGVIVTLNSITPLCKDTLLLNSVNCGLLYYCIKEKKCYSIPCCSSQILSKNFACSLPYTLGQERIIFAGSASEGLYVINLTTNRVYHYTQNNNDVRNILSNHIRAISADNNQGVWISTTQGISYFHPSLQKTKFYYLFNEKGISPSVQINVIQKTGIDTFLVGTDADGLYQFNAGNKDAQKILFTSNKVSTITAIIPISDNEYWLATNKGLYTYSTITNKARQKAIANIPNDQQLLNIKKLNKNLIGLCYGKGAVVYDIATNSIIYSELGKKPNTRDVYLYKDKLWLLRLYEGYELYDLTTKEYYQIQAKETQNIPIDFQNMVTSNEKMYISTNRGIVTHSLNDPTVYEIYNSQNGLEGDDIQNVGYNKQRKQLYYTTPAGLFQYIPNQKKSIRLVRFENYESKFYNQMSVLEDESIVCSISNYFIIHFPKLGFKNQSIPSCLLENFEVNGKKRSVGKQKLVLSYEENNITIKMGSYTYPESDKNIWYYKINENDSLWLKSTNGTINLDKLPPKDYQIVVFAENNEGAKSEPKQIVSFKINNPFYKSYPFFILLMLLPAIIVFIFFNFRKKKEVQMNKTRNQISRDLHDELGANVSSINILAKMLAKKYADDQYLEPIMGNISQYSIQISDTLNDIIWNVSPKFDSMEELIKRMNRLASESLESAAINYNIVLPSDTNQYSIPNDIKYNLFLIFKEALNNIAKYSAAKEVNITISIQDKIFQFIVTDDGVGFDKSAFEKGNGLGNMQNRAAEIGAKLSIQSALGRGTHIKLSLKI